MDSLTIINGSVFNKETISILLLIKWKNSLPKRTGAHMYIYIYIILFQRTVTIKIKRIYLFPNNILLLLLMLNYVFFFISMFLSLFLFIRQYYTYDMVDTPPKSTIHTLRILKINLTHSINISFERICDGELTKHSTKQ